MTSTLMSVLILAQHCLLRHLACSTVHGDVTLYQYTYCALGHMLSLTQMGMTCVCSHLQKEQSCSEVNQL